jgi:hypothetical protein
VVSCSALTSCVKVLCPVIVYIYEVASKLLHKINTICMLLQLVRVLKMDHVMSRHPASVCFVLREEYLLYVENIDR